MILDSSAIVAIAQREPVARRLVAALVSAREVGIAPQTWLETSIVLASKGMIDPRGFLQEFGLEFRVESIAFTAEHGREALDAWERYGKGHHAARLNFGDCISYATARIAGRPLLFVGDDFARTDIEPALGLAG